MSEPLVKRLMDLGFSPISPGTGSGDFELRDEGDGSSVYISLWNSSEPCPFPDEQRAPPSKVRQEPEQDDHPAKVRARQNWEKQFQNAELMKARKMQAKSDTPGEDS